MSGDCPEPEPAAVLADLLRDTHAAVYAYGVLGARLGPADRRRARTAFDAHRAVRGLLRTRLRAHGAQAPASAPAYDVTASGSAQALALAVRVEEGLAVRWRDLVAVSPAGDDRRLAVQQLQDCAVRAAAWRRVQGPTSPTVPFPGQA